jgi:uncharacterized protein (TIGR02466 family)
MNNPEIFNPFGANLLTHQLPNSIFNSLVNKVNEIEQRLDDVEFIKEHSWSEYLAGKNSFQILMDRQYLRDTDVYSYLLSLGSYYSKMDNITMGNTWINYGRKGDFNPIHKHDSLLSGVIYIRQDEKINEEMNNPSNYRGVTGIPGSTNFVYSLDTRQFDNTFYSHKFNEGHLLMFPSWMTHYVNPYHSEGDRITIAFNIVSK